VRKAWLRHEPATALEAAATLWIEKDYSVQPILRYLVVTHDLILYLSALAPETPLLSRTMLDVVLRLCALLATVHFATALVTPIAAT
jgi:hypothetical protein